MMGVTSAHGGAGGLPAPSLHGVGGVHPIWSTEKLRNVTGR